MSFDRAVRPQDDFFVLQMAAGSHAPNPRRRVELERLQRVDARRVATKSMTSSKPPRSRSDPAGSDQRKVSATSIPAFSTPPSRRIARPHTACARTGSDTKTQLEQIPPGNVRTLRPARRHDAIPGTAISAPDPKPRQLIVVADRPSRDFGLPDRSYYLRNDSAVKRKREAYVAYIVQLLDARQPARSHRRGSARILALKKEQSPLRSGTAPRAAIASLSYSKMTVAELAASTPSYNWHTYMMRAELGSAQ